MQVSVHLFEFDSSVKAALILAEESNTSVKEASIATNSKSMWTGEWIRSEQRKGERGRYIRDRQSVFSYSILRPSRLSRLEA